MAIINPLEGHETCTFNTNECRLQWTLQSFFVLMGHCDQHDAEVPVAMSTDHHTIHAVHQNRTGQRLNYPILKYPGMNN